MQVPDSPRTCLETFLDEGWFCMPAARTTDAADTCEYRTIMPCFWCPAFAKDLSLLPQNRMLLVPDGGQRLTPQAGYLEASCYLHRHGWVVQGLGEAKTNCSSWLKQSAMSLSTLPLRAATPAAASTGHWERKVPIYVQGQKSGWTAKVCACQWPVGPFSVHALCLSCVGSCICLDVSFLPNLD